MRYYFEIQYRRFQRKLIDFGVNPYLGFVLIILLFVLLSGYIFYKTEYAHWIFSFLGLTMVLRLSERVRNRFLEMQFPSKSYYKIRLLENLILSSPFVLVLIFRNELWLAMLLQICSLLLAIIAFRQIINFTIPTPFMLLPFEYIVGFRRAFAFVLLAYFLTYKAILVGNVNLGLGSLVFTFLIGMSFYIKPENKYFVWIYSKSTNQFLKDKIKAAFIGSTILSLPILISLGIAYNDRLIIILGIQLLGYVFLFTMILAKYSAFPLELNIPQVVLFALSFWFPPMLLIAIPIFYNQCKRRVKPIIE